MPQGASSSTEGSFAGQAAQRKFVDILTDKTPPLDVKLEQEGRYDEAIRVVLSPNTERPMQPQDYSRVAYLYLEWAKKRFCKSSESGAEICFLF